MERVKHTAKVFDQFLEIVPEGGLRPNSTYEIRIRGLRSVDGKKELDNITIKIHTAMTPSYCSAQSVLSLLDGCYVSEDSIMFNIREASKYANYLMRLESNKEYVFQDQNQQFEVEQFVRYRAAYDCTLKYYMEKVSSTGVNGTLGEVSFQNPTNLPDISKLLNQLRTEMEKWNLALQGHKEFRARPITGVKGISNWSGRNTLDEQKSIRDTVLQRVYVNDTR